MDYTGIILTVALVALYIIVLFLITKTKINKYIKAALMFYLASQIFTTSFLYFFKAHTLYNTIRIIDTVLDGLFVIGAIIFWINVFRYKNKK